MPISGLIVSFLPNSEWPQETLEALHRHPAIEVGEAAGHQLPIVVDTFDAEESRLIWEWLNSLPGVALIDVAFVNFEDNEEIRASTEES